jgi:Lsr2
MPRSTEQILAHADELARRFAEHEPSYDRIMDARTLRDIAAAMERRAVAEREIANAVTVARAEGHTWAAIGAILGTSGEAARQRYASSAVEHAHKASTGGRRHRARTGPSRERSAEIRAWAKQRGYEVSERGRIPASVVEQYDAATKGR